MEFHRLMDDSGLSPAEFARRMDMSKAQISKYLNWKTPVSKSRLSQAKRIAAEAKNPPVYSPAPQEAVIGMEAPEVRSASMKLQEIHSVDSDAFNTLHKVIGTYQIALKRGKKKFNSDPKRALKIMRSKMSRLAKKPSRKAAARSASANAGPGAKARATVPHQDLSTPSPTEDPK